MSEAGAPARDSHARYTKGELLGQGACKKVYKAFDEEEGIEVAWNEVTVQEFAFATDKERERVFGEIHLLKALKHKNILALHDYWFDKKNSVLVFITELFMDGSLRSYRRKHKNVDTSVLKRWAWQILQGLVYLHGHNPPIIHRDLKSDNIFINGTSGVLKIGDLGFATFRAGFSAAMSVIGTPEFMAPELYEERYNEKVDVYSFGLCLMELATLEYPYAECRNPAQIFKKVTQGIPPQGLAKITDDELREFVTLCIRQDAAQRPEARQLLKHPFFDSIRDSTGRRPPGPLTNSASAREVRDAMFGGMPTSGSGMLSVPQHTFLETHSHDVHGHPQSPAGSGLSAAVQGPAWGLPNGGQQQQQQQMSGGLPPLPPMMPQRSASTLGMTSVPSHASSLGLAYASNGGQGPLQQQGGGMSGPGTGPASGLSRSPSPHNPLLQQQQGDAGFSGNGSGLVTSMSTHRLGSTHSGLNSIAAAAGAGLGLQGSAGGSSTALAGTPGLSPFSAAAGQQFTPSPPKGDGVAGRAVRGSEPGARGAAGGVPVGSAPNLDGDMSEDVMFEHGGAEHGRSTGGGAGADNSLGGMGMSPDTSPTKGFRQSEELSDDEEGAGSGGEDGGLSPASRDMRQRVRLACRNHQDNLLAFSMSFVNHRGTRKKVGFQYDMQADTAREVAAEMVENLSLDEREAEFIADLIQGEIHKYQTQASQGPTAGSSALTQQLQQQQQQQQQQQEGAQQQQQQAYPGQLHQLVDQAANGIMMLDTGHEHGGEEEEEEEEDPSCFF